MMSHEQIYAEGQGVPRLSDDQGHRPTPGENTQGLPYQNGRVRIKKIVHPVRFATLNVGSMTGRSREIANTMNGRRVDIMCVQETRWKGNKAKEIGGGCKLLYSSADESGRSGVGVILNREMKEKVVEVERKGSRIMKIKVILSEEILNVVSAYAPQVGCEDEEKEKFWQEMDEVMTSIPVDEKIIIGGDLNGHVGIDKRIIDRIHGGMGLGVINEEGESIVDFAVAFDMALVNTFFKKNGYATYRSGGRVSQIDFIMCRRRHLKEVKDCKVINGENVSAQHKLVVGDFLFRREGESKKRGNPRIKWWELDKEDTRARFKENVLRYIKVEDNVDEWWEENSKIILKVGEDVLGKTSGKGPPNEKETWWWDEETQDTIKKKKEAKKTYDRDRTEENKRAYKEENKIAKKTVARAKAAAMNEFHDKLDTTEGQRNIYKIAKARDKATKDLTQIKQIKYENGKVLAKEGDIKNRWREYFNKLLNEENTRSIWEDGIANERETLNITRTEVKQALNKMKSGKAVGPDGIPVEVWKSLGEEGVDILWDLMSKIYQQENIPESWRNSLLVPIYKDKGDVQNCGNYRGIKLMAHTMKVYERIIEARVRSETEVSEEQFGFMPGKGTTDAIFILRQIVEKYAEKQKELHLVFIDLEKAYDRVPRQEVWRCMREKGVSEKYVKVLKDMYEGVTTQVRSSVGTTEQIQVRVGLHQGSALSPYIFAIIMDVIVADVKEQAPWSMLFADDIVLVATSREEAERKTEMWRQVLEGRGLRISRTKTEYLWMNGEDKVGKIKLGEDEMKRVKAFKYLGSHISDRADIEGELNHRIQSAWFNWRRTTGVLCDRRVSVRLKGKVYKSVVRPAMTYGAETWPIKKAQEKRMEVAEMRMLRWMCGVTKRDKIRNDRIRGTVKVVEVSKKLQERRLQWYGHVMRREDDFVCKRIMNMDVDGRRRRGRPKTRWKDTITKDLREKGLGEAEVQDRRKWKRLIRNSDPI